MYIFLSFKKRKKKTELQHRNFSSWIFIFCLPFSHSKCFDSFPTIPPPSSARFTAFLRAQRCVHILCLKKKKKKKKEAGRGEDEVDEERKRERKKKENAKVRFTAQIHNVALYHSISFACLYESCADGASSYFCAYATFHSSTYLWFYQVMT